MENTVADSDPVRAALAGWTEQVRLFLLRRLGDARPAQDLAQEAASRLLREQQRGVEIREPRAWLFRTARNLAVDEVRRRTPRALGLEWQARLVDPRSVLDEPTVRVGEGLVCRSELVAALPEALASLPVRDRGYLCRYYLEGGSCESLAREEQITVHTARVRLFRARGRLRALLETRVGRR